MRAPPFITAAAFADINAIGYGFFTRQGGVSDGLYDSLNIGLGSDDDRDKVMKNRDLVRRTLGAEHLVTAHQTHSNVAVFISERPQTMPKADALVTNVPGLAIGALAADCAPILLADGKNGVVGAAHSGWRGAFDGIAAGVIDTMCAYGAQRQHIQAVIGPCISKAAYEIGPEFIARFERAYAADLDLFTPSDQDGHFMFDLPHFVKRQITRCDVAADWVGACTYADETRFFSYRRTTHRGEPDYGRQISAICLS